MRKRPYLRTTLPEEALRILLERTKPWLYDLQELLPVTEALGRVTAEPVFALRSVPHYRAAAMDGVALKASLTFGADLSSPRRIRLGEEAFWVSTGDPLPEGCDAVVMAEEVHQVDSGTVELQRAARPWQHVRPVGEDMAAGEMILPRGWRLRPWDLGALLGAGIKEIWVKRPPLVGVIPTGGELVEATEERPLREGEIPEFDSTVIEGMVREVGARVLRHPIVRDDLEEIRGAMREVLEEGCDIVVLLAGSSAGERDYVAEAIASEGELLVHGVGVMPGRPTALGVVRGKAAVGLPGYPVSAVISADLFLLPLLEAMLGQLPSRRPTLPARLLRSLPSKLGLQEVIRVKVAEVRGKWVAYPLARGAGLLSSLVRADGLLRVPPSLEGIGEGKRVEVELLRPPEELSRSVLAVGSHDMALDILADELRRSYPPFFLSSVPVGSLDGLLAIRDEGAHLAGSHLLDPETGAYNIPYIRKYLEGVPVKVVRFLEREQGLIVPKGNPKGIRGLEDLSRPDVTFVNRQRGSGTRVLLDHLLKEAGIRPEEIKGYAHEEYTHLAVAVAVREGGADVGMGIRASAQALGLDFVPLATEQYDLVIPEWASGLEGVKALLDLLSSSELRRRIEALGGYDTWEMGKVIWP